MKAILRSTPEETAPNVVRLPVATQPRNKPKGERQQRFGVFTHLNRSGTVSFQVRGTKRNGERVRQNFADEASAKCRQMELETEWLTGEARPEVKATKLTDQQIQIAEAAFLRLGPGNEAELMPAIDNWLSHGRQHAVQESPRLDEAVTAFKEWLDSTKEIQKRTKGDYRVRLNTFSNSVPNLRIADFTPESIHSYLSARNVDAVTRKNDKKALSRFFSWCSELDRKWIKFNPCRGLKVKGAKAVNPQPAILTLDECEKLLRAAEAHRNGRLVPYVALCLFGGLRPDEAARIPLSAINLKDREIRVEAHQSKVKRARVVKMPDTLHTWLSAHEGKPVYPKNWRRDFDFIKAAAGYGNKDRLAQKHHEALGDLKEWVGDIMRHTAISHYFRNCGSYGLTAEWAGNSEAVIKQHYQGRVTSEETNAFYSILPNTKGVS